MSKDIVCVWCDTTVPKSAFPCPKCGHDPNPFRPECSCPQCSLVHAYFLGLEKGLWRYAWWKEGIQYVGTSGDTLEKAREDAREQLSQEFEKLYHQAQLKGRE